jgi:hypothetical protein
MEAHCCLSNILGQPTEITGRDRSKLRMGSGVIDNGLGARSITGSKRDKYGEGGYDSAG